MIKSRFLEHDKDKLLKRCPFCGSKAKLRSPRRLEGNRSSYLSDISCIKGCITFCSYNYLDKDYNPVSREKQDELCIKAWNKRK